MDFERAIQTQRNALLCLLAGWLAVVVLLSAAPVSPQWTRRMRGFLYGVLWRAELAARYLLNAQTGLIARWMGGALAAEHLPLFADPLFHPRLRDQGTMGDADEPPSLAELRARLLALRCLLKNLPRRALRLLQRATAPRDVSAALSGAETLAAMRRLLRHPAGDQCASPSPWHPPKRLRNYAEIPAPPSEAGAEALARGL